MGGAIMSETIFPARNWREYKHRYRMEASKCKKCGYIAFPTRLICPDCKAREFEEITLPREGKVISYTVQHVTPSGFEDSAPYIVGIVELTNGVRLTTQIADCGPEDIKNVKQVTMETRRVREEGNSGVLAYGYKFVPAR